MRDTEVGVAPGLISVNDVSEGMYGASRLTMPVGRVCECCVMPTGGNVGIVI